MTAVRTEGRFTRADLDAIPREPGRRYELLDGAIIVTPSPMPPHQRALTRLWKLLDDAAPDDLEVFVSPLDVYLTTGDVLEPDVLVVDPRGLNRTGHEGAPLLAVEVRSPSSMRRDVGDKLTAYRDAGVPSYWVVDTDEPRLRVWRLEAGDYVAVADVRGDEEWTADAPYPVTVRPSALVGPRPPRT